MNENNESLIKTLKLKSKTIGGVIGLAITIGICKYIGLPPAFVKMFAAFAIVCYLFFIILDVPDIKEQSGFTALRNFFVSIVLFSLLLTLAGWAHPQYRTDLEIAKINTPPLKEMPSGPEAIEAGYVVFQDNKCTNCHKTNRGGSSDRGPNLLFTQVGSYSVELLKGMIVDPRKSAPYGFLTAKAKKEMPTYYGEDLSTMDLDLVVVFLQTQVEDTKMPVRGNHEDNKPWQEFDDILAWGKAVYEGEANEDVNCSVCHGADGIPLMSDAADLREKGWQSKANAGKTLGDMNDGEWYKSVMMGVEDTAMAGWEEMGLTRYDAWCVISYVKKEFTKL